MTVIGNKGMIYIISIIPFILNDFSNIHASSYEQWVLVDYACRIAVFIFIGVMLRWGKLTRADLLIVFARKGRLAYWTLFLSAMTFVYCALSKIFLAPLNEVWKVSEVVYDRHSALFVVDMSFGLVLAAVSEEIISRGLALSVLRKWTNNVLVILVLSSFLFALIHWSTGLRNIIDCFVCGAFFMGVTMRTGSIVPAVIVHFALDYSLLA